jgi:hypothetical protein
MQSPGQNKPSGVDSFPWRPSSAITVGSCQFDLPPLHSVAEMLRMQHAQIFPQLRRNSLRPMSSKEGFPCVGSSLTASWLC